MAEQEDSCHFFTEKNCRAIGLARGISGLVVILTSMISLIAILLLKAYKKYSQRLFLYLTLTTLLHAPVYIMEVLSVECYTSDKNSSRPKADEPLCTVTGVADIYSSWLQNLMILWITLYLFRVVVLRRIVSTKKLEISIIILFLVIPIPAAVIPLINRKYGISGAWCWFITYKTSSCNDIDWWGLGYQLGIWYIPFFIETIVIIVTVICILMAFIKRGFTMSEFHDFRLEYRKLLKESLPLLIFPVTYCIINIFEIILDLIGIKKNVFSLWIIDAIMNPSKAVLVIGGYLISLLWVRLRQRRNNLTLRNTENDTLVHERQYDSIDVTSSYNTCITESTTFSLKR